MWQKFSSHNTVSSLAHPLPWCQSSWSDEALANITLCTFGGINNTTHCFDINLNSQNFNSNSQKVRQCAEDETIFRLIMILVIVLSNLASLLATLRLTSSSTMSRFIKLPAL